MKYEIQGGTFPALVCTLQESESIITVGGNMGWMSPNMHPVLHKVSNMSVLRYTAMNGFGTIGISSKLPGNIIPIELGDDQEYICQRSSLLAVTDEVKYNPHLSKYINNSYFNNKEFSTLKISGRGIIFLEVDGSPITYNLQLGQKIVVEPGHLVVMATSCNLDLEPAIKNDNSENFNAVITGPGRIIIQSTPLNVLANEMAKRN